MTYNFGIKAKDAANNLSNMSNVLSVLTYITTSLNLQLNEYKYVSIQAKNLNPNPATIYEINYDPAKLQLIDLNVFTLQNETTIGIIPNTDIEVVAINEALGIIKFITHKQTSTGRAWTGTLNTIKFKAKVTSSTNVYLNS